MKYSINFFLVILIICLESCSSKNEEVSLIKEVDQQAELVSTYAEAIESLKKNDTFYAANKFLEAELLFPQSDWAPKSALMAAYSFYLQDYFSKSIFHLERFLTTYPNDKRIPYAYYLLAMCYYENIEDEKRDLLPLIKSKEIFKVIMTKYPNSDFALDAKFKIDFINDIMASKEIYIGRHYIKKEKWIAAINRLKTVITKYETTIYVEEALHRLVEIYYIIGLEDVAKKYAKTLGYNYQSSEWYENSYKLFNQDYKIVKKKKLKKKKDNLLDKIKSFF